ncbi:MAG: hypothetical protein K2P84_08330 [Undibacterium sp.]|nr:hypothetical protein [Undibacterium sp.]
MKTQTSTQTKVQNKFQRNLKTIFWLVRREWWEYPAMFKWLPVVVASLIAVSVLCMVIVMSMANEDKRFIGTFYMPGNQPLADYVPGNVSAGEPRKAPSGDEIEKDLIKFKDRSLVKMSADLTPIQMRRFENVVATWFTNLSMPVFILFGLMAAFYASSNLHSERSDRSILFWKSLPFSDTQAVLAKLMFVLIVAPLFALVVSFIAWLAALLGVCIAYAAYGEWLFARFFMCVTTYTSPLSFLAIYPVYLLWSLPIFSWFFMVSAWAKKHAQALAFGFPFFMLLASVFVSKVQLFGMVLSESVVEKGATWLSAVLLRQIASIFPGSWFYFQRDAGLTIWENNRVNINLLVSNSWGSLAEPQVWIAFVISIGFILVTIRLRKTGVEI